MNKKTYLKNIFHTETNETILPSTYINRDYISSSCFHHVV